MRNDFSRLFAAALFCALLILASAEALAQAGQSSGQGVLRIDASHLVDFPAPVPLGVASESPDGHSVELTDRYLLLDGKPALPVMGEFQYSRYPEKYWEEELLKMKAGGVRIVSTYVFWVHHEEVENEFNWSGNRDLRRFAKLCKTHGFLLIVRIGPYVHGEARNGGLPDWVLQQGPTRRNDPVYLSKVRRFYQQIGMQLRGELWKDGGSVIGVQIENEYFKRGADAGAAHISELKKLALEAGLDVPLYTVTGWGNPDFPAKEVIPVFGVYPDAFWESSLKELPPNEGYTFSFRRDLGGIAIDPQASANSDERRIGQYPYFLAEAGGGMQVAYHRRPLISADDVASLFVTHVGAGANLYGYYIFQGGSNPTGKKSTMQESAAVDGVYDLPVISYDFQAPLGEFGQVRPSYRILKEFHLFLSDFGSVLATMIPVAPAELPSGSGDLTTPRYAARVGGDGGFLFFNNYVREYGMSEQRNVRFEVKLAHETIVFPQKPVNVRSGSYFIWPLNLDMDGVRLKYSTAQPLCKLNAGGEAYYFFFEQPGISAEFEFDGQTVKSVRTASRNAQRMGRDFELDHVSPGSQVAATAIGRNGRRVNVVLLSAEQAKNASKAVVGGEERVMISAADVFVDGTTLDLRSTERKALRIAVFPALGPGSPSPSQDVEHDGIFTRYSYHVPRLELPASWTKIHQAEPAGPVKQGTYNALAPVEADFEHAAWFRIGYPGSLPKGCSDVFLTVQYRGDVAHLYRDSTFLADDFFYGRDWEVGLKRFLDSGSNSDFILKIMPLRSDAPIFMEPGSWPVLAPQSQVAEVKRISVTPEYEVRIALAGGVLR